MPSIKLNQLKKIVDPNLFLVEPKKGLWEDRGMRDRVLKAQEQKGTTIFQASTVNAWRAFVP